MSAPPAYFKPNTIYAGDCLNVLRMFPANSVDFIYADPPFFTNRHYEVIWGDGYEIRSFKDRWKGGIENYIAWMKERVAECARVLKKTGSIYLHCDWHASHYLKVEVMDKLFGESNFRSEIVWKRQAAHSDTKQGLKNFGHIHDVILFYTASDEYTWHTLYTPYDEGYAQMEYKRVDEKGRRYREVDLTAAKPGGDTSYEWHGVRPYKGRYWAYSREKMDQFYKEGRLIFRRTGMPRLKMYLEDMPGVPLQDVWADITPAGLGKEALGYPTQKPEELLKRIITTSSNPTDLVLDPFCGCGTALAVAQREGRRWIGIDVSPTAIKLVAKRLRILGAKNVNEIGLPVTGGDLRRIEPFEFQNWVDQRLFGRHSARKTSDMGIDGYTFEGHPIQVKQSDDVGRNVVDNFETAMRRSGATKGVIVAFSFGKGANEEVARAKLHDGLGIQLITVSELLQEKRPEQSTL